MVFTSDVSIDKEDLEKFKGYLYSNKYSFQEKKVSAGIYRITIDVPEVIDAFLIGCNLTAITNDLFIK